MHLVPEFSYIDAETFLSHTNKDTIDRCKYLVNQRFQEVYGDLMRDLNIKKDNYAVNDINLRSMLILGLQLVYRDNYTINPEICSPKIVNVYSHLNLIMVLSDEGINSLSVDSDGCIHQTLKISDSYRKAFFDHLTVFARDLAEILD